MISTQCHVLHIIPISNSARIESIEEKLNSVLQKGLFKCDCRDFSIEIRSTRYYKALAEVGCSQRIERSKETEVFNTLREHLKLCLYVY